MAKRILLICSGGGHMVQMKRILPAMSGQGPIYLAAVGAKGLAGDVNFNETIEFPDFNRKDLFKLASGIPSVVFAVLRIRPSHVVSTGAAPGIIGLVTARLIGARTLWIDSVANTRKLSLSGRLALIFSNEVFTQWEHLAKGNRPAYKGRII